MNPELTSSWTESFDWVLFTGATFWVLAGMAALKTGLPDFSKPRTASWLWGAAFCALSALGMVCAILHANHRISSGALLFLEVPLVTLAFFVLVLSGRCMQQDGERLIVAGLSYLFIWVCGIASYHQLISESPVAKGADPADTRLLVIAACLGMSGCALGVWIWMTALGPASLPLAEARRSERRRHALFFVVIVAALLGAGVLTSEWRCRAFLQDYLERSIWRVKTAALGLDLNTMLRLSGKPSDRRMPAFALIAGQLLRILQANADIGEACLWTVKKKKVTLMVHQNEDGRETHPPGTTGGHFGGGNPDAFTRNEPYLTMRLDPDSGAAILSANERINNPSDQTNRTPFAWLELDFNPSLLIQGLGDIRLQMFAGTFLAIFVAAAIYEIITRLGAERDSEREKLALVEAERERFARDLHDGLGQTLSGLAWRAKALSNRLDGAPSSEASELAGMLSAAVGEARSIAHAHVLPMLQTGGLREGLAWLSENTGKLFGATCRIELPDSLPSLPSSTEHALMQIAREAVHNSVRHGHARNISVKLAERRDAWAFEIVDDGRGMPVNAQTARSMGLRMITARMHELGGSVDFLANSPTGVRIRCRLPLTRSPSGDVSITR